MDEGFRSSRLLSCLVFGNVGLRVVVAGVAGLAVRSWAARSKVQAPRWGADAGAVLRGVCAAARPGRAAEQHSALRVREDRRLHGVLLGLAGDELFVDRLLATLVNLRHGTTHDVLACWFGGDRSTIPRAINEVRPLLAQRGCTVARGIRLRALAGVIEYLDASDQKDELVLRPGSYCPRPRPRSSREPSRMLLVPQRPYLSNQFSDRLRRQPSDPLLRHDQPRRPTPVSNAALDRGAPTRFSSTARWRGSAGGLRLSRGLAQDT
ncbi:transposase family protein [Streptomyces sp. Li-HN-5-11]|uniref:transposase family protein n=1 Tax=Streptomyces sp. Li-HN-5-11 TaxID=3075432 RepID=UPI0037D99534